MNFALLKLNLLAVDVVKALQQWSGNLTLYDIIPAFLRTIAWWIILGLYWIIKQLSGVMSHALDLLNLYGSADKPGLLYNLINDYMPIFVGVSVLVVVALTIGILFSKDQSVITLLKNLLLGVAIFVMLPFAYGKFTEITTGFGNLIVADHKDSSSVGTPGNILDQNIIDLYAIDENYSWDKNAFDKDSAANRAEKQNYFDSSGQDFQYIKINEVVKSSNMKNGGEDVTNNSLYFDQSSKTYTKVKLSDGAFGIGAQNYYRYSVNWWNIILYEVLFIIVMGFLVVKAIQISIEINFSVAILSATALTDVLSGKRNLALLTKIVVYLGTIIMVFFLGNFFTVAYDYIWSSMGGGWITHVVASIALLFAVIDGPNVWQSVFGVDAGLKSVGQMFLAMNQGLGVAQKVGNGLKGVVGGGLRTGAAAAGFGAGIGEAMRENSNSQIEKLSQDLNDSGNSGPSPFGGAGGSGNEGSGPNGSGTPGAENSNSLNQNTTNAEEHSNPIVNEENNNSMNEQSNSNLSEQSNNPLNEQNNESVNSQLNDRAEVNEAAEALNASPDSKESGQSTGQPSPEKFNSPQTSGELPKNINDSMNLDKAGLGMNDPLNSNNRMPDSLQDRERGNLNSNLNSNAHLDNETKPKNLSPEGKDGINHPRIDTDKKQTDFINTPLPPLTTTESNMKQPLTFGAAFKSVMNERHETKLHSNKPNMVKSFERTYRPTKTLASGAMNSVDSFNERRKSNLNKKGDQS